MSSATSEVAFRLAVAGTYSQSAGRVTKFCTDGAPRASMVSVLRPSAKTRVNLGPAPPPARPTRSISMRQPTSMGPNARIQRQFGAPHRDLPSWAQCRTYSSRDSTGAARVVVLVVASTANERRARIASINAHCGGSGQEWLNCSMRQGPDASLAAAFFTDPSSNI